MSWRDSIAIHPAADIFPLLNDDDLVALGEDIKRNGLAVSTAIQVNDGTPILLDGRNPLDAMERVGLRVKIGNSRRNSYVGAEEQLDDERESVTLSLDATVTVVTGDPVEYITSTNIHRRNITAETKRDLIAKLLKENPERSDRATAELVKVDHKTVAAVRRNEEQLGSIPQLDKRTGKDGKARPATATAKPAIRPEPASAAAPVGSESEPKDVAEIAELRQVVTDAAISALRGGGARRSNKNPNYVPPSKAGEAWTNLYGTARAFNEWATPQNLALAVDGLNERSDDQSANLRAVVKFGHAVAAAMQTVAVPAPGGDAILEGVPPTAFKSATTAIGEIKRFAEFCRKNSPMAVAAGILPHEAAELRSGIAVVDEWLSRFAVALDDRSRQAIVAPPGDNSVPQVESSTALLAPTNAHDDALDIPAFLRRPGAANGAPV
jgi:hypothetical protein